MRATPGKVIIKRFAEPEKTQGGLYVPEIAKQKPQYGTVVAVGRGDTEVQVGDVVFFDGAVDKFSYESDCYHCLSFDNIAAVIDLEGAESLEAEKAIIYKDRLVPRY